MYRQDVDRRVEVLVPKTKQAIEQAYESYNLRPSLIGTVERKVGGGGAPDESMTGGRMSEIGSFRSTLRYTPAEQFSSLRTPLVIPSKSSTSNLIGLVTPDNKNDQGNSFRKYF